MRYQRTVKYVLPLTLLAISSSVSTPMLPAIAIDFPGLNQVCAVATANPVTTAERQLKDMGESVHRAKAAAVDLVRECTRVDELAGGEIDFIGTDVIPILPATADGLGNPVYIPPRKRYIDMHMSQLGLALPILKDDVTAIQSPDPTQAQECSQLVSQMQQLLADISSRYKSLQNLASQPAYDRASIVSEATAVHQDIDQIDRLRKKIYGEIKHDPNDKKLEQNTK